MTSYDSIFELGAVYEVRTTFDSLGTAFATGERLLYRRHVYSRYDGMDSWIFLASDGADSVSRRWDVHSGHSVLPEERFERVAAPHAALVHAASGDLDALAKAARVSLGQFSTAIPRLARELAVEHGHTRSVELLVHTDAVAGDDLHLLLRHAVYCGQPGVVRTLVGLGANPDAPDRYQQTARKLAERRGGEVLLAMGEPRGRS